MNDKEEVKKEKKKFNLFSNRENVDKTKDKIRLNKTIGFLKSKRLYVIAVIVVFIALIVIFNTLSYMKTLKYKPYIQYEDKMKVYGFDTMYNNKSAKTSESVTKAEALKLALAATFNTSDITDFASSNNSYVDATWVEYAEAAGITSEKLDASSSSKIVDYISVIEYFENCKLKFLTDYPVKNTSSNLLNINTYNATQQAAIKDMVASEIIKIVSNKFDGRDNIFKGQLNELVVNFVEKYNTITVQGEKININPEKIPSNANQYPYTLASVDKSIYEKPFAEVYQPEVMQPVEIFKFKKEFYPQIERYSEEYLNAILNVNYTTITEDSFRDKISEYLIYKPNDYAIKKYVENVKNNEIIIEGSANAQFPTIYTDGVSYRIRMKVSFEIKSSNTKTNLIYLDYINGLDKTYEKTKYDLIVDYYMTNSLSSNTIFMKEVDLYGAILDKETCGITQKEDTEDYSKDGEDANE